MTDPEPAESCQVSLLVPHPGRIAVLVAEGEGEQTRRPCRPCDWTARSRRSPRSWRPSAMVDSDTTPALRLVMTSATDAENVEFLLEFEPAAAEPPRGWGWQDLDGEVIARLEPESSRNAVASWVHERATGWSPLRPQWSRPGWFARASSWMVDQMAADGRPAIDPPRQHQLWDLSVVLRASSADGQVFLKCSPELYGHEAVATQGLAAHMPGLVPEVIAVDGARGWLLMRDLGAAELGDQDPSLWDRGMVAHAGIQQSWLGRADELVALGLPVRSLPDLAAEVEALTVDAELMGRMPADVRQQWLASAPALAESCRRLDELGPGPTLVHGDLHPWNVAVGPTTTRVFDWSDAAVSHPFVDLAAYVLRSGDLSVRRRLVDAYVGAWSGAGSEGDLQEAASLGLVVGALYQVQTYRALLPTLPGNGADDGLAGADLDWIKRCLSCHEHGLEGPS